jgi:hypothetical protein
LRKGLTTIFLLFLLIIFQVVTSRADHVIINDGTRYEGAIIQADDQFVYVQLDAESIAKIPHQLVSRVFFRHADTVYLLDGSEIKCKLLEENFPDLRIVSGTGQQLIRLGNLKRYFYNNTDSLITTSMPSTGPLFNNQTTIEKVKFPFRQTLSISIAGGLIVPPADKWQSNFLTDSSPMGALVQGHIGFNLIEKISVILGYNYSEYGFTVQGDLDSKITSNFYHLGVKYSFDLDFLDLLDLSVGADIGLYSIGGDIYSYSYRKINLDQLTANIAYRPHATASVFVSKNLAVDITLGYLLAQDFTVQAGNECQSKITIPMSGMTVCAGINYRIPINLW